MCVNPKYNIKQRLLLLPGKYLNKKYELAIAADVSERTIDNWMNLEKNSQYSPPVDKMILIANFFNVTLQDLMNG